MFSFTPSSGYDSTSLRQPRHYRPELWPRLKRPRQSTSQLLRGTRPFSTRGKSKRPPMLGRLLLCNGRERMPFAGRRSSPSCMRKNILIPVTTSTTPPPSPSIPNFISLPSQEEVLVLRELERRRQRQREEKEAARIAAALEREKLARKRRCTRRSSISSRPWPNLPTTKRRGLPFARLLARHPTLTGAGQTLPSS
ncbi:hypothetical protein FIBSPDRAFT_89271 [Athelia psychrophila]|uniref:Uncharacterized protein n=1 Tax=Athelia psychrophila TaxID=1759441 RepID=A0A166DZT6_9AGAM|nr:hypothetical protein FIBSPDRAFT_89271 [Fibularhizoctonia sp. CBS 109695]